MLLCLKSYTRKPNIGKDCTKIEVYPPTINAVGSGDSHKVHLKEAQGQRLEWDHGGEGATSKEQRDFKTVLLRLHELGILTPLPNPSLSKEAHRCLSKGSIDACVAPALCVGMCGLRQ